MLYHMIYVKKSIKVTVEKAPGRRRSILRAETKSSRQRRVKIRGQ